MARGEVGHGNTITFWQDNWGHGTIKDKFPELFSYSSNVNLTIKEFLQATYIVENFHTPLSTQAHQQFQDLQAITQQMQINSC